MSIIGWKTFYGDDGKGGRSKYLTRINIGRLCVHLIWRGDVDQDCHDHPWDFWTFPLVNYVESVIQYDKDERPYKVARVVPAWQWHYRPAIYCHRILGKWCGKVWKAHPSAYPGHQEGLIVTLVWKSKKKRDWGFLRIRPDGWRWVPYKSYLRDKGESETDSAI